MTSNAKAMKAGAADYLVKDQLTPQLMERVIRALDRAQGSRNRPWTQ